MVLMKGGRCIKSIIPIWVVLFESQFYVKSLVPRPNSQLTYVEEGSRRT